MLKQHTEHQPLPQTDPAAFGRLCVETCVWRGLSTVCAPAAFGRLCVETSLCKMPYFRLPQPPSGGCVLKLIFRHFVGGYYIQPPSGGCVLKLEIACRNQCI